jgi:Uma2 family endonuclease
MDRMGLPAIKLDEHYNYRDYKSWPEDERWELIGGIAYEMSPAPTTRHQFFLGELHRQVAVFLEGKPCRVILSPVDVFFPMDAGQVEDDVDTVVQPDLVVVCDSAKIRDKGIWGAPDWIVEILSPSSHGKDLREKFDLYEKSGVGEYWVADPGNRSASVFRLSGTGRYEQKRLFDASRDTGPLPCDTLPGFLLDTEKLFKL